jgi:ketosteroid isomerase-like protein
MKLRTIAFAALLAAAVVPAAAATNAPSASIMQPVRNALASLNTGSAKPLAGIYATNATIVDEFAPYSWSGANAGKKWYNDFQKFSKSVGLTNAKGTLLKPTAFDQSGNRAYLVLPVDFGGTMKGKTIKEHGTWTFTLQRSGSTWQIVTQSWGTVTETM